MQVMTVKDGREVVIREAEARDAAAVLAYINRVCGQTDFLSFGPGEYTFDEDQQAEFLAQSRFADHRLYMLALIDDQIVGCLNFSAGASARVRHVGEFGMSVDQTHWGLGIGGALVDALLQWAKEMQFIQKINLRVRSDNQRAIDLYQRKGFAHEGRLSKEIRLNGAYYDVDCMGLMLSQ